MAAIASRLGSAIEVDAPPVDDGIARRLGLGRSRSVVFRLAALFSLDAFAGGFVPLSLMAFWFTLRFDVSPATLGAIFFASNLLSAVSALSAARIAARFGLINTMVFTHLPSNVLLMLVPLMPTLPLAVAVLLLRFSLSQMDVPTRQSYVMAVVEPDERSAAAGVTGIARTVGAAISPSISTRAGGRRSDGGAAVLHRGRPEDRVRPADLSRLPGGPTAGGGWRGAWCVYGASAHGGPTDAA